MGAGGSFPMIFKGNPCICNGNTPDFRRRASRAGGKMFQLIEPLSDRYILLCSRIIKYVSRIKEYDPVTRIKEI